MGKKLILLTTSVAAIAAFALPAAANALTLRDHEGTIPPGATVVATSNDFAVTNTPLGTLFCNHTRIETDVIVNSGTRITLNGSPQFAVFCEASGETLIMTGPTFAHLESTGGDKGRMDISFIVDVGPFECPYHSSNPLSFEYGTGEGQDEIHFSEFFGGNLHSILEICEPEEGSSRFEADFTLSTFNGAEVWIS